MKAHTPGPWRVDGQFVVAANPRVPCSGVGHIATVDSSYRKAAETAANAELIASAPDMRRNLDALIDEAERALAGMGEFGWSGRYDALRAAIAAAKGEK